MTQFAEYSDFETRLGITLTTDEQTRVDSLLTDASGLIQDAAGQEIAYHATDTLTIPGTNAERIPLPERPVVSVESVTIDGRELVEGTDWYLDGDQIARFATLNLINVGGAFDRVDAPFLLGSGFGRPNQELVIVYTHGYEAVPKTFKEICLEAVVRVWVNPGSVARATVGNTSTVYDNNRFSPTGLLLTEDEQRRIRRIVGGKARSIQIGG